MQAWKKVHLLHLVLLTLNFFPKSLAKQNPTSFCGKITIQKPFFPQNSTESSLLSHMVVCKSQKLYFRTSLGLFQISSIDYTTKLLTISHSSCSSSSNYVSPALLSAGFPSPPNPNSLALFDCSSKNHMQSSLESLRTKIYKSYSCLFVNDTEKLDKGFHPNDLNCSRYSRVYRRNSSVDDSLEGYELGTRISFDIPNHVPNICDECNKPHGNCGIGLKCICHPKDCKDKVISKSVTVDPFGNILFSLLSSIVVIVLFKGS
ncbi:hypothetical protein HYC85_031946 [Camellia sinensis]|uniref:Wall-associated receptor kinase C-terminal domain-containing protein n=1 Tax=Camellia sinensis TaxID=4442 RepID=A0A7J7FRV0_CAMSI|nr:hypothetical protein HYC85_031946 [Camellia sinensis]